MGSRKNCNLPKSPSPLVSSVSLPSSFTRPLNDYSAKELSSLRKDSLVSLIMKSRPEMSESTRSSPAPQPSSSDPPLSSLHASDLKALIANSVSEALSSFSERLDTIESRLSQLEANYSSFDSKFQQFGKLRPPSDSSAHNIQDLQATISAEIRRENERRTKEKNLIISGLAPDQSKSDEVLVQDLCINHLSIPENVVEEISTKRIGPQDVQFPKLIVTVSSISKKILILKKAKLLRNSKDPSIRSKVFINPDLTKEEQHSQFLLRQELRRLRKEGVDAAIYRGALIQRNQT